MKKGILSSILVAFALVVTLGLVGCGGGADDSASSSVVGTWKVTSMTHEGTTVDEEALIDMLGEDYLAVTFNEDGTVGGNFMGETADLSSTYKIDGDRIYIDDDTENYFVIDGDTLTADIEGSSLTLIKK